MGRIWNVLLYSTIKLGYTNGWYNSIIFTVWTTGTHNCQLIPSCHPVRVRTRVSPFAEPARDIWRFYSNLPTAWCFMSLPCADITSYIGWEGLAGLALTMKSYSFVTVFTETPALHWSHQLPPIHIQDCRLRHPLLRSVPKQYARGWKK